MTWFNNSFVFDRAFILLAIDVSLKVTMVAAAVLLLLKLFRTRDSATLHRANSFILLSMLLMPVLAFLAPRITLPLPTQLAFDLDRKSSQEPQTHTAASNDNAYHISSAALNQLSQPAVTLSNSVTEPDQSPAKAAIASETTSTTEIDLSNATPPTNWIAKLPFMLLCVYGAVACAILLRLAVGLLKCRTLLNRARSIDLKHKPRYLNSQSLLMESDDLQIPIALGLWRPVIVLPVDWHHWSDVAIEMAIAHESEHIVRGDTRVSFLASLNCAIYWFHPLSWYLSNRLSDLAEHACDDAVISATGNRAAYAQKLIALASRLTADAPRCRPASVGMARQPFLEKRVMRIIDSKRPLSTRLGWMKTSALAAAILAIATAAAGLSLSKAAIADDKSKQNTAENNAADTASQNANTLEAAKETKAPETKSRVTGRVLSSNDEPVVGAQVRMMSWNADRSKCKTTIVESKSNGEFVFESLPEGAHELAAYFNDLSSRTQMYHGVTVQRDQQNIVLKLQKAPSLHVQVTDKSTGKPVSNARVRMLWTDTQPEYTTDSNGRVTFPGLTHESWTVEVLAKGYAQNQQAISLTGDEGQIKAALEPGFELHGKVIDPSGAPIAGMGVNFYGLNKAGIPLGYAETDEQGDFRYDYLPLSGATISATKDNYEQIDTSFTPPAAQSGGQSGTQRFLITLLAHKNGGSIAGIVQDTTGSPIAGATIVNGGGFSNLQRTTKSDANGKFHLDNVYKIHNQYAILVEAVGFAPELVNFTPGTQDKPTNISVKLATGHTLNGRVVDANGNPIQGVSVAANGFSYVHWTDQNKVQTDSDGRFTLDSLLEADTFTFEKSGYSVLRNVRLTLDGKEPVTVKLKEQGRIRGKVVNDATGQPISQFTVHIEPSAEPWEAEPGARLSGPAVTDAGQLFANEDGTFELTNLYQGMPVQVTLNADGYQSLLNRKIKITVGETTEEFRLQRLK